MSIKINLLWISLIWLAMLMRSTQGGMFAPKLNFTHPPYSQYTTKDESQIYRWNECNERMFFKKYLLKEDDTHYWVYNYNVTNVLWRQDMRLNPGEQNITWLYCNKMIGHYYRNVTSPIGDIFSQDSHEDNRHEHLSIDKQYISPPMIHQ